MMVDDMLVVIGDVVSCDGGIIVSTNTVASVVDVGGRFGDAGDSGGDVVVLVLIDELVSSWDRSVAVDGSGVGNRGVHGAIDGRLLIGLTSAWTLDDFKVAIAKYISPPPISDTNLKEITASSKWEDYKSLFEDRQVDSFAFIDIELVTRLQGPLENDN
ncbi:hypothetical protein CQW23_18525 [Capsicum baccatum]|uniref:Uncharacterized protein n=1 Tax=Capsicum baccatum TaxID=33114 RepID=A0A2G2W369_CAPBA|nr:hypothetical protein CQW23_18525 [Capsicum baccatum]